jgi:hypothetical protein
MGDQLVRHAVSEIVLRGIPRNVLQWSNRQGANAPWGTTQGIELQCHGQSEGRRFTNDDTSFSRSSLLETGDSWRMLSPKLLIHLIFLGYLEFIHKGCPVH